MQNVKAVLSIFPGSTVEKIYPPATPSTVDVMYVNAGKEQVLPAQQILQPSDTKPFNASS